MQNEPYPQSPLQPAPQKKKAGLSTLLFVLAILLSVLLVVAIAVWAWLALSGKTSSDTGKTPLGAAQVLEPQSVAPQPRTIDSSLGIKVSYNARELEGYGFADDVTYSADDLNQKKPYSVIRVRPVETSEATRNEITLESPELRVTSSLAKNYWDSFSTKKEYKDLSKVDILVKETVDNREADKNTSASDAEVKQISDAEYRKVTFTTKDESYAVPTSRREDCYMSVQNDRPFVACINNIRASNFSVLPQLEQVLSSISYDKPDQSALMDGDQTAADSAIVDASKDEKVTTKSKDEQSQQKTAPVSTKVADYMAATTDFMLFAKAQPSVARVGMIYCADIKLTLPEGTTGPQLTNACVDKASSGFFISRDGTLATSASAVQVKPQEAITSYITSAPDSSAATDRLQRILSYLVESRSMMQTDADAIVAGVAERNQDIIDKVTGLASLIASEDIAVTKEKYTYAVQLSNKPTVVNEDSNGALSFAYTDSVVDADLVVKNYSADKTQEQIYNGDTIDADTAILKVKRSATYDALRLAQASNVTKGGSLDIVGMPMYAYGSLGSAQFKATPLYRQGKVDQLFSGANGQKILSLTTSSHAGLAGAPALDNTGAAIGVATYGNLNCPDRKCFASTVVRDTSDIVSVAKNRNLTLQPDSAVTDTWSSAVNELTKGNYKTAFDLFNQSSQLNSQNYLAAQFAAYSKSQFGSASDTSTPNQVVGILQVVIVLSIVLLILLVVVKLASRLFVRPHTQTQYGQLSGGQYIDPNQWQQGSQTPQNIPQPQPLGQQTPYPQQPQYSPQPYQPGSPLQTPPQQPQPPYAPPQQTLPPR